MSCIVSVMLKTKVVKLVGRCGGCLATVRAIDGRWHANKVLTRDDSWEVTPKRSDDTSTGSK